MAKLKLKNQDLNLMHKNNVITIGVRKNNIPTSIKSEEYLSHIQEWIENIDKK